MSYDLEVYGKVSLTAKELAKVVSSVRGLKATVDRRAQTISSIVHKRGRAAAFELDGPNLLEPEDIPEEWTEAAGSTVLYSIHVPYAVQSDGGFSFRVDERDLAAATAFAARLAERIDGTVIDSQTVEPREPEPAPEPEPPRPRFLHLRWYRLLDDRNDQD
ncbi:hypothetical protein, partial [Streptomyces phaeoluteigriseus]|uniref:hypothetical protein n=2 Tax=Actinomycetes TaxID=1760 RepID=UPI0036AD5D69